MRGFFLHNWPRKIVALLAAMIIWLFVDKSITETKTIPNVPIRIVNLPPEKTIVGLLPNRILSKRVALTLSGSKDVIQEIEPGDLEVLLDVSTADTEEWLVQISKKNLVSLNPDIDLAHNITQVGHTEFTIKLSPLVSAKIPIKILPPLGEAPSGYDFLDIWPQKLTQTVSGAEEEIQALKAEGLELVLNLNEINKSDLDALKTFQNSAHDDEVSFHVPQKWKKIILPCQNHVAEEINDPDAQYLRIDFLRKSYLPIQKDVAIRVFYPIKNSDKINPSTYPLAINSFIKRKDNITYLSVPLYARDVSRLFIDIIRDNLEIAVVAAPESERQQLAWSIEVIDPHELEDMYVAYSINNMKGNTKRRELFLRKRFKEYLQRLSLFTDPDKRLHLESKLGSSNIEINVTK